jgi:hypothetical protein
LFSPRILLSVVNGGLEAWESHRHHQPMKIYIIML